MKENLRKGMFFENDLLSEIREKFVRVNNDVDGRNRLFFENAGGSLRLKSVCQVSNDINMFPDCYEREHKSSKILKEIELKGREDLRILLNAKDGAIATCLTASSIIFDIIGSIVKYAKGNNIVTTSLEHPSAFDACRYYANIFNKDFRVSKSNRKTGNVDMEHLISLIDENTCLLNIIFASNITGAVLDIEEISRKAREINPDIYIVTDAVQHAVHGIIDVEKLKIDAVTIAPYKFFGNRGISFAYVSERVKNLPHKRILDDYDDLWELGSIAPAHYAVITEIVNYLCWIGKKFISSSMSKREQLVEGMNRIMLHERALMYHMIYGNDDMSGLYNIKNVETFFDFSNLFSRDLIVPIAFKNITCTEAVKEYENEGIIVYDRIASSIFSKRVLESFDIEGVVRVSPLHCNSIEDIDEFLRVTNKIASI